MVKPDEPRDAGSSESVPPPDRRPYHAPELVEYGSVAKLTQGGGMSGNDGVMMMFCL
jgi:hypothetical protein